MDLTAILNNIGFDWRVALANFANFLLIFYLLKRFAFGPISRVLQERKKKVEQGIEDATRAATERQMAEQEFARRVMEAKDEANSILAAAQAQEESILAKAHEQGEIESNRIVNQGQSKVEAERVAMERQVKEKAVDVVIEGVEKVLRQKLSSQEEQELFIKKAIA